MSCVLVTGTFDTLHSGHIKFLKEASRYGEVYVGIGSDESVEKYKGKRPICSQQERLFMLKAIRYVEDAWVNSGEGPMDFVEGFARNPISFDYMVVSEDQDMGEKQQFCDKWRIQYVVLPRLPECGLPTRSSTSMRRHYEHNNTTR